MESDHQELYHNLIRNGSPSKALDRLTEENLLRHRIKVVPISGLNKFKPCFRIKLLSICRFGMMANYQVSFSRY